MNEFNDESAIALGQLHLVCITQNRRHLLSETLRLTGELASLYLYTRERLSGMPISPKTTPVQQYVRPHSLGQPFKVQWKIHRECTGYHRGPLRRRPHPEEFPASRPCSNRKPQRGICG